MTFHEKVQAMMQRSGKSYQACLRTLAAAGGRAAGRNKRRRRAAREREVSKQAALRID